MTSKVTNDYYCYVADIERILNSTIKALCFVMNSHIDNKQIHPFFLLNTIEKLMTDLPIGFTNELGKPWEDGTHCVYKTYGKIKSMVDLVNTACDDCGFGRECNDDSCEYCKEHFRKPVDLDEFNSSIRSENEANGVDASGAIDDLAAWSRTIIKQKSGV